MNRSQTSSEAAAIVDRLQRTSHDVFAKVVPTLQAGMTEVEIAVLLKNEFARRGYIEFWYDVPIFVMIGAERLLIDIITNDYGRKAPSEKKLRNGDVIYIDLHPVDSQTKQWGDWNSMAVFHPRPGIDDEQVAFLDEVRTIHRSVIDTLTGDTTAGELVEQYLQEYADHRISVVWDHRKNFGHTMHQGPKLESKRFFLTEGNPEKLGSHIWAVEPSGFRKKKNSEGLLVGRFEECIWVPESGKAKLLGSDIVLPLSF